MNSDTQIGYIGQHAEHEQQLVSLIRAGAQTSAALNAVRTATSAIEGLATEDWPARRRELIAGLEARHDRIHLKFQHQQTRLASVENELGETGHDLTLIDSATLTRLHSLRRDWRTEPATPQQRQALARLLEEHLMSTEPAHTTLTKQAADVAVRILLHSSGGAAPSVIRPTTAAGVSRALSDIEQSAIQDPEMAALAGRCRSREEFWSCAVPAAQSHLLQRLVDMPERAAGTPDPLVEHILADTTTWEALPHQIAEAIWRANRPDSEQPMAEARAAAAQLTASAGDDVLTQEDIHDTLKYAADMVDQPQAHRQAVIQATLALITFSHGVDWQALGQADFEDHPSPAEPEPNAVPHLTVAIAELGAGSPGAARVRTQFFNGWRAHRDRSAYPGQ